MHKAFNGVVSYLEELRLAPAASLLVYKLRVEFYHLLVKAREEGQLPRLGTYMKDISKKGLADALIQKEREENEQSEDADGAGDPEPQQQPKRFDKVLWVLALENNAVDFVLKMVPKDTPEASVDYDT